MNLNVGIVAGYGRFNETRRITSEDPLKVELPRVDDNHLVQSRHVRILNATSEGLFVAGCEFVEVGPTGDIGSGFYVKSNGKFYLRRLVSCSLTY